MNASPHVIFNGELLPAREAKISPLSQGFMFGYGLFETIRAEHGRALRLEMHHARLGTSSAALGLDSLPPLTEYHQRITRLLAAGKLPKAAVKIIRFRDLSGTGELITARPFPYASHDYIRGFRIKTMRQSERTGRLTHLKTLNYLENHFARQNLREQNADEIVFVTSENRVIEGTATNIFCVKNGLAFTPPIEDGPLPGVMRAQVIALLGEQKIHETHLTLDDLHAADEVFLTNALLEVMPVCQINDHRLPSAAPFITALRAALRQ